MPIHRPLKPPPSHYKRYRLAPSPTFGGPARRRQTFDLLRQQNVDDLPLLKQRLHAHLQSEAGEGRSIHEWLEFIKMHTTHLINYLRLHGNTANPSIAKDIAATIRYLDLLAYEMNIDLGEAIRNHFER